MTKGDVMIAVGNKIRSARKHFNLKQSDLAEMIGVSRTSIVNAERGRQMLTVDKLFNLAENLGVSITLNFEGYKEDREKDKCAKCGYKSFYNNTKKEMNSIVTTGG